jgi:hypothetical protein
VDGMGGGVAEASRIGYICRRMRRADGAQISDIATVVAAVGGGAVTGLFGERGLFGMYAIGLFIGFFAYLGLFYQLNDRKKRARQGRSAASVNLSPA